MPNTIVALTGCDYWRTRKIVEYEIGVEVDDTNLDRQGKRRTNCFVKGHDGVGVTKAVATIWVLDLANGKAS